MSYHGRGRANYNSNGPRNGFNDVGNGMNAAQPFANNNGHNRNTSVTSPAHLNNFGQQNQIQVEVWGWNNATPADLVSFLSRKTRISLMDHSVNQANGAVVGYVRSKKDAESLINWNGVKFAGQSLKISLVNNNGLGQANLSGLSSTAMSTVDLLKEFLRLRYNAQLKMLDLSKMQQDQLLMSRGLLGSSTTSSTSSKMFMALMKIASEDSSIVVETVVLSDNSLNDTFTTLSLLGTTFPRLLNLSLEGNRIARTKFFENWKNKFNNLRELVLLNNPISQQVTNYQFELMKIFPKLVLLDGHLLRDEAKLKKIFTFPLATKQMFFETPDIQSISTTFITNYLKFWDENRQELLALYSSPESQFSLQVDSTHPSNYHQEDSNYWSYYIPNSRNLSRISNERSRLSRLHKGAQDIYKIFQQFPKTKHSLLESPHLFSMESYSYPQVNGIIISLHGEYEEVGIPEVVPAPSGPRNYLNRYNNTLKGTLTKRSFDRTFVVVQGPDQSMIIASDLFLIRAHGGEKAWTESAAPTSTVAATPQPAVVAPSGLASPAPANNGTMILLQQQVPPDILNSLSTPQRELLAKVFQETKLNAEFSLMLCQQSNWDFQSCMNSFNSSKGNIPLSAYQQ